MASTIAKHFARGYQEALRDIASAFFTRDEDAVHYIVDNLQDRELAKNLQDYYFNTYGE